MDFQLDGSRAMWSTLTLAGSLALLFLYGVYRREHTRVWPIVMVGVVLDIATQVWFAPGGEGSTDVSRGLLLYPLFSMVAAVAGIMTRVGVESLIGSARPSRSVSKF